MPVRRTSPALCARCLFAAVLAALAAGCGGKVYEGRLEETKKHFEFIEKQNVNLANTWTGFGSAFSLRVPIQYRLLDPPKVRKDPKTGKVIGVGEDTRQPDFIPGGLPGLVGAWKADYTTDGKDKVPGYLYLLSNYELWLDADRKTEAEKFHAVAVAAITNGLRAPRPMDSDWKEAKYPASEAESYLEPRPYTVTTLKPQPEINGMKHDVAMYLSKSKTGDIQVVLVSIVPQGIRPLKPNHFQDVSPNERLSLALATLTNAGKKPVKNKPGAGGEGATAPVKF